MGLGLVELHIVCQRLFTLYGFIGPILMTVGPWKPIALHSYRTSITEVDIRSNVSELLDVNLTVDIHLSAPTPSVASVVVKNAAGVQIAEEKNAQTKSGRSGAKFDFAVGSVDLWYPVGYGKQPIYTVEVTIRDQV